MLSRNRISLRKISGIFSCPKLSLLHVFGTSVLLMMLTNTCWSGDADQGHAKQVEKVDFNRSIRPILAEHCFSCHGPDESSREAELRLDQRDVAISSGAITPDHPGSSEMIKRILSDDSDLVMPPPEEGAKVSPSDLSLLRDWIEQGAAYAEHWSFRPVVKPELPPPNDWSPHPIDRFILRRMREFQLEPNKEATPWELVRRVALDLTGLPPSEELARSFLADPSSKSYENLVDGLLSQDSYGEHWARMWLDLARYADTKGYEKDRERTIWRYRDWVINAFNSDLPYDQFTIEQSAGDLLPDATMEQRLATAFHRNTMENDEGGTDDEEFRVAAVKDRVDTTMQVWMGLTAGCAKCHSHKYDPISQAEYYQLYAFFNQTTDADRGQPTMPTPTSEQQRELDRLEAEAKQLQAQYQSPDSESDASFGRWMLQFDERPLWEPLRMTDFQSNHSVDLQQADSGDFDVVGELPEKDTWTLTLPLPDSGALTAIRIETLPKQEGGKWPDKNVVIRELTAELVVAEGEVKPLKLSRPRADFSQRSWEVNQAIDGKPDAGWAFSPHAAKPHCAVFDFEKPIDAGSGNYLRLTLEQEYGSGLVLDEFRLLVSTHPTIWLTADLQPVANLRELYRRELDPRTKKIAKQIEANRTAIGDVRRSIPAIPVMQELASDRQRETKIHRRGNFLDPGEKVLASVPETFGALPQSAPVNRLGVAQWLLQDQNPLTSRVTVNRFWARLFGRGLVETEEDFGTQGMLPTHPLLLDWLAVEFRENGWSVKKLLKTIVMSKTYRQSARFSEAKQAIDPRNESLSRGPRFRLSAEMVRDQALAVSGLLTHKIGGPSVMPPQPDGIWKSTYSGEKWKNAEGADRYRRAIYTYKKRTSPYPAMMTFDAGSGEVCQIRRIRTNTPLQALVTLNDDAFFEAAGGLAKIMETHSKVTRERLAEGFRRTLIREATERELERLLNLYDSLSFDEAEGQRIVSAAGLKECDPKLITLANVLLNLDETLTKP